MLIDLYFQTKLLSKLDHFHVASPTPKLSKVGASYTEFFIKIVFLSHRWSFDKGVRGDGGTGGQNPTIGAPFPERKTFVIFAKEWNLKDLQ